MYTPSYHQVTDPCILHDFIRMHPFGMLVSHDKSGFSINHIPFILDSEHKENACLFAHVAKANPVWKNFSRTEPCVVVFQGANSYISPSWYPSKHAHGKAVPTWNYTVVHVRGIAVVHQDRDWILHHINQLTDLHEAEQALPWKVSDAPDEYIDRLVDAIVGIEIPINDIEGKWKLNQNKSDADRQGVIAGLSAKNVENALRVADSIKHTLSDK